MIPLIDSTVCVEKLQFFLCRTLVFWNGYDALLDINITKTVISQRNRRVPELVRHSPHHPECGIVVKLRYSVR